MTDIISDLYNYICENAPAQWKDPEYDRAVQAYMEIEDEVKKKIGSDLLSRYQDAEYEVSRRQDIAVFLQTLRFSSQFFRTIGS